MCSECYDHDFTTPEHPFDHPVKCVYTPIDVELYFGGEYLNDPPQSYRCPYCKQWGYNESTFLEHVSAEHVGASTLLVSTMVTLFEQQQALRLFLEDEQLAVLTSAATSRNEQMNRTQGSLELYLEPLNPNGSYQQNRPVTPLTFRVSKPSAVEVAPWLAEPSNSNHNMNNNFVIPESARRQPILDGARHRLNQDRSPLPLQQQQQLNSLRPTISDIMRTRISNQTPSGRSINLFRSNAAAENARRSFFPPGEIPRSRSHRHRNPRMHMEVFPASGGRQVHVQRLRGGPGPAPGAGPAPRNGYERVRSVGFADLNDAFDLNGNLLSGPILLSTIEEEELQPQQPATEDKQLENERERFLCSPFLSSSSTLLSPPEERISFLVKRAEFVAQLLASVLCEEELTTDIKTPTPIFIDSGTTEKLCNRSTSEFVGAGDSKLDLKHTTPC